jgi:hypothetical protein
MRTQLTTFSLPQGLLVRFFVTLNCRNRLKSAIPKPNCPSGGNGYMLPGVGADYDVKCTWALSELAGVWQPAPNTPNPTLKDDKFVFKADGSGTAMGANGDGPVPGKGWRGPVKLSSTPSCYRVTFSIPGLGPGDNQFAVWVSEDLNTMSSNLFSFVRVG